MPELQSVGHVALTVTNPKRSADFYNRLFDAQTVLTVEDEIGPLTICVSPAMMFGFRTHPSTGEADRFDPARVGLDHLGFHVADRQQLEAWQVRLERRGAGLGHGLVLVTGSAADPDSPDHNAVTEQRDAACKDCDVAVVGGVNPVELLVGLGVVA